MHAEKHEGANLVVVAGQEECRRWYDEHPEGFRSGVLARVRHLLFEVTPGVPVEPLPSE
jgi:hypothetical protein